MAQQGVTVIEGQPEVLAPAPHRLDASAGERRREAYGPARVTAYRPRVEHLHGVDGGPEDVPLQAGPDHMKTFTAQVRVGPSLYGHGVGRSKKEAEQGAAETAYAEILASAERDAASAEPDAATVDD